MHMVRAILLEVRRLAAEEAVDSGGHVERGRCVHTIVDGLAVGPLLSIGRIEHWVIAPPLQPLDPLE